MKSSEILAQIASLVGIEMKSEKPEEVVDTPKEEVLAVQEPMVEEEKPMEEEKMADPIAELDARIKALEDAIAKLVVHEAQPEEAPAMDMKKEKMSKPKKFNGAPTEQEAKPQINKVKGEEVINNVWKRMSSQSNHK